MELFSTNNTPTLSTATQLLKEQHVPVELTYNEAYGSTRDLEMENSSKMSREVESDEHYEQLQVSIPDIRSIDLDEEDYDYVVES